MACACAHAHGYSVSSDFMSILQDIIPEVNESQTCHITQV